MNTRNVDHGTGQAFLRNSLLVARCLFWFGVLWCVLGIFITFVPGGEQSWFTIAAVFTAFGLLVPSRFYRVFAIALVVFAGREAFDSHTRGVDYRQRLESPRAATPPSRQ